MVQEEAEMVQLELTMMENCMSKIGAMISFI